MMLSTLIIIVMLVIIHHCYLSGHKTIIGTKKQINLTRKLHVVPQIDGV